MKIKYPETRRDDVIDDYHGVKVQDPYRWLEDTSNPEVQEWIDQQNKLTKAILKSYPGGDVVRKRTKHLLAHESMSNLVIRETKEGTRFFYMYKHPEISQPMLCYQDRERGERRELVNTIKLKPDGSLSIDWFFPSWDGRYVAYGLSESGTEDSVLHVFDLATNDKLQDEIPRTGWALLGWANTGFYYTRYPLPGTVPEDEMNCNQHVYFHQLGTDHVDDPKIFGEGRAPTEMSLVFTHPKHEWVLLVAYRYNSSDVYISKGIDDPKLITLIESDTDLSIAYLSSTSVFVETHQNAKNGRILKFELNNLEDSTSSLEGVEVIEEGEFPIEIGMGTATGYLTYTRLKNASHEIVIHDLNTGSFIESIEFPSPVTVIKTTACPRTKKLYLSVQRFTGPDTIQTYEIGGDLVPFFEPSVEFDFNDLQVKQVWYKSKDSTDVSMFLLSSKSTKRSNHTPILIRGYGCGGIPYTPQFHPEYMIWLENGGILAIPNIRGGGEYGDEWHKNGIREYKQNGFDDFIAAAEWLHTNGYGAPETTAIMGRSGGGFLVGAIMVQRPDLFASVYCGVPLLDLVRYIESTIGKFWIPEFGDPYVEEEFQWIYTISPYHNVREAIPYPAVLFYTALGDHRADPSHALKTAARVQQATSADIDMHPILLSVDKDVGHSAFGLGLSTEKLVEIRSNQVIFHAKHTGLNLE
ncbi:MAG: prolyl oligopeptidase family serine peptidase [Candidatus Thorarchaeota archaeon]|jgi:prolyl oligopeptidase